MKYIKQSLGTQATTGGKGAVVDPEFEEAYPAVFEFMTCTQGEKGRSRKTASLTIFVDGAAWKVFLNDRETVKSLCVTAFTWADLVAVLEKQVTSEVPGWRDLPGQEKKGKKGS